MESKDIIASILFGIAIAVLIFVILSVDLLIPLSGVIILHSIIFSILCALLFNSWRNRNDP